MIKYRDFWGLEEESEHSISNVRGPFKLYKELDFNNRSKLLLDYAKVTRLNSKDKKYYAEELPKALIEAGVDIFILTKQVV